MSIILKYLPHHKQLQLWGFLFLVPALLILIIFRLTPVIMSLRASFFNVHLLRGTETFVGLDNFAFAVGDKVFIDSLKTTGLYVLMKIPVQLVLALGLAMLVNRRLFLTGLVRTTPLMAVVMPISIAAMRWQMMYHPGNGLINSVCRTMGRTAEPFLTDVKQALPALVGMTIWKDLGFYMIFYLAGLQSIPGEYYDAAKVDGASIWSEFRYITFPLLKRTTIVVLILSTVFAFQVFVPVYVMTDGGPRGVTNVIVYYMYTTAFHFMRMGYANTIAIITLVIVLIIAVLQLRAAGND
jgi:ABC-type sugar transport system permease subunit